MEYCGGGSVRDLIQILEEPFSCENIAIIMRETLQVLNISVNCRCCCFVCFFQNSDS